MQRELFDKVRIEKLRRLRELGVDPYPYKFEKTASIGDITTSFDKYNGKSVKIAGRITSLRMHGKVIFMDIAAEDGKIQLYFRKNHLQNHDGKNAWEIVKLLDTGDIIGVEGMVFKTNAGEKSIWVHRFEILSKSLYPIPFGKRKGDHRWYSVEDPEILFKERYITWNVYPETREKIYKRSKIIKTIRDYMDSEGFLEVQTPTIEMIYGGAEARPFETEIWALGKQKAYLRISPELYLKRFIVGGFPKVYTICQNFRNEGIDKYHNPEFTMMEWYEAYTDYEFQMKRFEELVSHVVRELFGTYEIEYKGVKLNFAPPWRRLRMVDAIKAFTGFDIEKATDSQIKDFISQNDLDIGENYSRGLAIATIFEELCEDKIVQPTFITDHPKEISPLTKEKRGNPDFVERFEPFVMGMELGNAYSELNDPLEQLKRFEEQRKIYRDAEVQHHPIDYDFIKALSAGMPPTGGVGLGIDRLIMILTNSESIREIIPFPMVKPKIKALV